MSQFKLNSGAAMRGKDATQKRFTAAVKKRPASNGSASHGRSNNGNGNDRRTEDDAAVLRDQPSIAAILGGGKRIATKELERTALLSALIAFKKGDFSVRLPSNLEGMDGKIADAFNEVMDRNERMSEELERLSRQVGKEGKISQRATIGDVTGAWKDSIESGSTLISDLVHPVSETARATR